MIYSFQILEVHLLGDYKHEKLLLLFNWPIKKGSTFKSQEILIIQNYSTIRQKPRELNLIAGKEYSNTISGTR